MVHPRYDIHGNRMNLFLAVRLSQEGGGAGAVSVFVEPFCFGLNAVCLAWAHVFGDLSPAGGSVLGSCRT